MTWTAPEVSLPEFLPTGNERPLLEAFLAWHRAVLLGKCAGLTGDQLAECAVPPSNLSLLELIGHLAKVERMWFRERIGGQDLEPMYDPALGETLTLRTSIPRVPRPSTSGCSKSAGWPMWHWPRRRSTTSS